ncbi:MAG: hypothetical protein QOJ35_1259 [Solirubrobacteraceae bacterium]|nr:hypothetical protein [Solirubrobacteraceae bacterium]
MRSLSNANLALKFVLELSAFAALAAWGATTGHGVWSVALAFAAPAVAIALWAVLAAPKSPRRLPLAARLPFELAVFAAAAGALFVAAGPAAGIAFAIVAAVNAALLVAFDQLEA